MGGYAEVVSEMELYLALKCGVKYENIIWNGPIKSFEVFSKFLLNGGNVNIDSYKEIEYIKEIIKNNPNSRLNIGIRCNFDIGDNITSRFGFDINDPLFEKALLYIKENKNINFVSLHSHFAIRDIKYWSNKVKGILSVIDKFQIRPNRIDVGGGMYGNMTEELSSQFNITIPTYEEYAEIIATAFHQKFKDCEYKPELIIEPGTAIVGDVLSLYCQIETIKNVRNEYFATVNISQKNISMIGINAPMEIIERSNNKKYKNVNIVGYTCIENDIIHKKLSKEIAVGDIICIKNCGSYSIVMKPPFILPQIPIFAHFKNDIKMIKRAETFYDIFSTFNFEI